MQTAIEIKAFGIAKDIVGGNSATLPWEEGMTVAQLKANLKKQFPEFEALRTFAIAINTAYVPEEQVIAPGDEIVIIPPVSGG